MLCLRARLPRQSADNLRRTSRQGFAHKLPRRGKKARLTRPSALCRFEGRLRKNFSCTMQRGLGVYAEEFQRFQATRRMTPLRCRCALHRKRELCDYTTPSWRGCPASPFGVNAPSDSVGTKTTRSKKKGRTSAPFGLPVGTRTRNNAVGGHRFIQLDYG